MAPRSPPVPKDCCASAVMVAVGGLCSPRGTDCTVSKPSAHTSVKHGPGASQAEGDSYSGPQQVTPLPYQSPSHRESCRACQHTAEHGQEQNSWPWLQPMALACHHAEIVQLPSDSHPENTGKRSHTRLASEIRLIYIKVFDWQENFLGCNVTSCACLISGLIDRPTIQNVSSGIIKSVEWHCATWRKKGSHFQSYLSFATWYCLRGNILFMIG